MPDSGSSTQTTKILKANEIKILRKIVGKTKTGRIRSQRIRVSFSNYPINEWEERIRENMTNLYQERKLRN